MLFIFPVTAFAAALWASAQGAGLTHDSIVYLRTAESLARGWGFTLYVGGSAVPVDHWPPFYPLVLSILYTLGAELWAASRTLNALLFAVNVAVAWLYLRRALGDRRVLTAVFMLWLTLSAKLLHLHAMVWSEPLYLCMGFSALYLTGEYLAGAGRRYLWAAAILTAPLMLVRYPSVAFLAAAVTALLAIRPRGPAAAVKDALFFLGIGALPAALWLARNAALTASPVGRALRYHPLDAVAARQLSDVASSWVFPWQQPTASNGLAAAFILAVLAAFGAGALRRAAKKDPRSSAHIFLLIAFMGFYGITLFSHRIFFAANQLFDWRTTSSLWYPAVLLAAFAAGRTAEKKRVLTAVLGVFVLADAAAGVGWAARSARDGLGYAAREWRRSPTSAAVWALDPKMAVYTNIPEGCEFMTGRPSKSVPRKYDPSSLDANSRYAGELSAMRDEIAQGRAVLVFYRRVLTRGWCPSEEELASALALEKVSEFADGAIYALKSH